MIRTRNAAAFAAILSLLLAPGRAAAQEAERPTLELTLDEAVERALKNNADLLVQKYGPELAEEDVTAARGYYDPLLSARLDRSSRTNPATNAFSGGAKVTNQFWDYNFGGSQLFKTGGTLSLNFVNNKQDTNSIFTSFNPLFSSTLTANLVQPLLRNRALDQPRQQLRISKNNRAISDVQFHETVVNTVARVKGIYYDVIAAEDNLAATRQSLSLAQKFLDENQIKVKVGTLAPLDVVAAESEVASRDENVIVAEALLEQTQDNLKAAIFSKNDATAWALRIHPTDRPTAEPHAVDADGALKKALEQRTDIQVARKNVDNNDIAIQFAKSQLLPGVDLIASYGATGIGGTQILDATGKPLPSPVTGGYGDAVSDVFGRNFPTWTVGVNVSYPVLNRQARAASARARLTKDQALASLNRIEIQIASEVRAAARAVETNYKRVQSTRAARTLQERRLDAESKKFAAGMSTNFLVTQAQRDLADASVNEITAILDYRKSLIDFDRVQEAGASSSAGLTTSLSTASTTRAGAATTATPTATTASSSSNTPNP